MQRFRLPTNVTGLTMRDGTKVDADRRGIIHVPERYVGDARAAMKDTQLLSDRDSSVHVTGAGKDCVGCGFSLWAWQTSCPKCELEQPAEPECLCLGPALNTHADGNEGHNPMCPSHPRNRGVDPS